MARAIGVKPQAVSQWRRVPVERAQAVAEATKLKLHELRPDVWANPVGATA